MNRYSVTVLLAGCLAVHLTACGTASAAPTPMPEPTAAPTENPESWRMVNEFPAPPLVILFGFHDAKYGIAIADDSRVLFTGDGGAQWADSDIVSMALFGLDIVDRDTAWACGNHSVRVTFDGAKTWLAAIDFGSAPPEHCRFISFLDRKTGWVATPETLGATSDGALSWTEPTLPESSGQIAAVSLYAAGSGCLLEESGKVFCTEDDGQSWILYGTVPLGDLAIASMQAPVAALRFQDALHGTAVVSSMAEGVSLVAAFQTRDGGQTWIRQPVTDTFGYPYLSRDGRLLTLFFSPGKVGVFNYTGE